VQKSAFDSCYGSLFEVYRVAERADIEKDVPRFIDPMKSGLVPWICEKRSTFWLRGHGAFTLRFMTAICGAEQEDDRSSAREFSNCASCIQRDGLFVVCTSQARLK
jgi:hypothetical protein